MTTLLVCVVLHELGHALMAQVFGINTQEIIMTPLGGLALMEQSLMNTRCEVWVAIAGPAVNFILAGMTMPLLYVTSSHWLLWFISINLMLGFFNLVPAFPMDGGRILRALLAKKYGYKKGTLKAINISRVFAYIFIVIGALKAPMLAIIGIFLVIVTHHQRRILLDLHSGTL
jgi:Zn-dependent protease